MIELVKQKLGDIQALCRKHRVLRLAVFGSALRDDFDFQTSDIDFLVEFMPGPRSGFDDPYFQLRRELMELFGRPIDLVESGCIDNPVVAAAVNRGKVAVYAAA